MIVGLTMRVEQAEGHDEPRDALSHDWIRWIEARGWTPLPVANDLADPKEYLGAMGVDAIVLTGGNDAVPRDGARSDYCSARNRTETMVLDWATASGASVLAVCRGLHMVNLYFGGTVVPDIGAYKAAHVAHDHRLEILDSLGGTLDGRYLQTNSYHEQGVTKERIADVLRSFAVSSDGLVEGAVHAEFPILAVQWHPERKNPAAQFDILAATRLFNEGAFWRAG